MNHQESLTRYIANFIQGLWESGLEQVVISPGSRSTPLAMLAAEHPFMKEWIHLDERSAAFFALGMAKETKKPVALICTSGTAAANYYPAVIEAFYSRVPLLVLTADRPHELRDVGAPQAIEQFNMYGSYVKWFHEMALPEQSPEMLQYSRQQAGRAVFQASQQNAGPVQLNFPLREPLVPDFTLSDLWGQELTRKAPIPVDAEKQLNQQGVEQLLQHISGRQKGVIIVGPQEDEQLPEAVTALAEKWQLPILSDPLSGLRSGSHKKETVIETFDTVLRFENIREQLRPDFIIRFGAMPVSKPCLFYLKENKQAAHIIVEETAGYREPAGLSPLFIYANPVQVCQALQQDVESVSENWLHQWQQLHEIAKEMLSSINENELTEGHAVAKMLEKTPDHSNVFVGNSMPIRDLDTFFFATDKNVRAMCNRGANGIDGVVSSALGAAAAGKRTTLVIGDLSFYHDLNALMIGRNYKLNITIIIVNNNGGGIFSFLPQAKEGKHFEALFGTPTNLDFRHAAQLYGVPYKHAADWEAYEQALEESYQQDGMYLIEIHTDRNENAAWHRTQWGKIEEQLMAALEK